MEQDGSNCTVCDGLGLISYELEYFVWGFDIPCPACSKDKK